MLEFLTSSLNLYAKFNVSLSRLITHSLYRLQIIHIKSAHQLLINYLTLVSKAVRLQVQNFAYEARSNGGVGAAVGFG